MWTSIRCTYAYLNKCKQEIKPCTFAFEVTNDHWQHSKTEDLKNLTWDLISSCKVFAIFFPLPITRYVFAHVITQLTSSAPISSVVNFAKYKYRHAQENKLGKWRSLTNLKEKN